MIDMLRQDLRTAWRGIRNAPGFTLSSVLSLGIGAGVVTAVFTLVYAVLIRPLPYPEDPVTYLVLAAIMFLAGALSCLFPAVDASRLQPAEVLKETAGSLW